MNATSPKYPKITVKIIGQDGNAFAILGRCTSEMRKSNIAKTEIDAFMNEAMSGDYGNLLQACMRWFNVR